VSSASVTLKVSLSVVEATQPDFQLRFCQSVALALNISANRVLVTGVRAGSALLDVAIIALPPALSPSGSSTPASANVTGLALQLAQQAQSAASPLAQLTVALDTSFTPVVSPNASAAFLCSDGSLQLQADRCCLPGYALNALTLTCASCQPGFARSATQPQSVCQPCAAGSYSSKTTASECSICPVGSTVNAARTACTPTASSFGGDSNGRLVVLLSRLSGSLPLDVFMSFSLDQCDCWLVHLVGHHHLGHRGRCVGAGAAGPLRPQLVAQ
jgi:hypothetical protein